MFYNLALFLHILGAVGIFSAVSVNSVCLAFMRRVRTVMQVRLLADIAKTVGNTIILFAVLLLIPACYMVISAWSFGDAWILGGLVVAACLALVGSTWNKQHITAIQRASHAAPDGLVPTALRILLADPLFQWSERILLALLVGVVFLMTNKPDLLGTLLTLAIALILALISLVPLRRRQTAQLAAPYEEAPGESH